MAHAILRAQDIAKRFKQGNISLLVFDAVTCSFAQGNTYALMGVSGAGKSTLLHILAGLDEPTSGAVFLNDKKLSDFTGQERHRLLNASFGLVLQSSYLIHELSMIENIMMPGLIAGVSYELCQQRARELLTVVGLLDKSSAHPLTLSGGQQQRVAIVRALFNKPAFLFADEPTGNLDEKTGRDVLAFLLECQREWKMGLIVSTHDAYVADGMDTRLELHEGKLRIIGQ